MASANDSTNTFPRRHLLSATASAALTGRLTAPDVIDPIWRLLREEQAAWEHLESLSAVEDCEDSPEWQAADHKQMQAQSLVCSGRASTKAGMIAQLDMFEARTRDWVAEPYRSQMADLLASVRGYIST